jgi:hypothetical protein
MQACLQFKVGVNNMEGSRDPLRCVNFLRGSGLFRYSAYELLRKHNLAFKTYGLLVNIFWNW